LFFFVFCEPQPPTTNPPPDPPIEGADYYWDGPYMVFTAAYHLKRGYCCKSGCRHCPYGFNQADN
jgi:hypothetical protein